MMEDVMKKDIGKEFDWTGKHVKIVNAFSCYEGDFYEYTIDSSPEMHRININTQVGYTFMRCVPR